MISIDTPAPPAEREQALRHAMQAHGRGEFAAARQAYLDWLHQAPEDADALHLLGVLQAQQGAFDEAAALISRAIAQQPDEGMFHNNLGNVCAEQGRLEAAESHYRRAVELDAGRLDAANNLAVIQSRSGRPDEARALFEAVLAQAPGFLDARLNFAQHCLREGAYGDAVQLCVDGLVTDPKSNPMRRLLGAAYTAMGLDEQAIELYRRWIEVDPDNPLPRHHLAACLGEAVPERASDGYVATVFDQFAASFDAKLAALDYRAPALIQAWVEREAQDLADTVRWRMLDAGCGTGLVGPLVRPRASRLVGVDLSAGMLRKAAQRKVYDDLFQGELVAFLQAFDEPVDVLLCADTLCYFGPLDSFARAARRVLVPGGRLVATVEAHPENGNEVPLPYRLHPHGRYSHAADHVESALAAAGFCDITRAAVRLRNEAGKAVQGWLVGARLPNDSSEGNRT